MKKLYFYLSMLIILLVTSCRQDDKIGAGYDLQPGEYLFSVTLPEPLEALSRSMGDVVDLEGKEMHVLVFDKNGFFLANQTASSVKQEDGVYTYSVKLPPSDEPCALHFILGKVDYPTFVPDDSESSVFSNLSVSGGEDAYWQRVEVDKINDEIKLPTINLIRNFAKISVKNECTNGNFIYQGFAIVRNTDAGTIAPYVGSVMTENGGFAQFGLGDTYETFVSKNHNFGGNTAGRVVEVVPQKFPIESQYVYERNQDKAQRPTYVLIKAKFENDVCYYKLDIVTTDKNTWITSYLNLYRNFHYTIHITEVKGAGYSTPEEAMQAAASNNIGASVEVSQVNTIQDGLGNELWVSTLDTLLVTSQDAEIYYRYTTKMDEGGIVTNEDVVVTPVSEGKNGVNSKAISDWKAENGVLRVTPAALPELMETQEFVIATPSGLARRVAISVRQPFKMRVDCDDVVPWKIGENLTLVVVLPENMPTAVFPLLLDIEPDRKSLYPDVIANRIPVHSEGNHTFSYQASVTYADYVRSRTCHFVFKTNMATSATTITVTNPYFDCNGKDNVASFINEGDRRYHFDNVTLNGSEGFYQFTNYNTADEKLTVGFGLHKENDGYQPSGSHPISIYPSNPERLDLEATKSSTGTVQVTENRYITYIPYDIYSRQEVTFMLKNDFATGTIQLSALDHGTETVDYSVHPLTVTAKYQPWFGRWQTVTGTINVYDNKSCSGNPMFTYDANDGLFTISDFGGSSMGTIWYFRYSVRGVFGGITNYDCSVTLEDLINNPNILLQSDN